MKKYLSASSCIGLTVAALFVTAPALAATITVTSTGDSGRGSLRNAVSAASPGDIIAFSVNGTITLASPITIAKDLTINGPATISGGSITQIFVIDSGASVTMTKLSIIDGGAPFGSAVPGGLGITNDGSLALVDCAIEKNFAIVFAGAGGIVNSGTMTIVRSSIVGNDADMGGVGGISNSGTITITDSFITGNLGNLAPGGIFNETSATIINSSISDNTGFRTVGGGIDNLGSLTVSGSTFVSNSAGGNIEGTGLGGAIANLGGTLDISNSTFERNDAEVAGAAIYAGGTVNIKNSTFASNDFPAALVLNGTASLTNSTFSNGHGNLVVGGSASLKGVILAGGGALGPNCSGTVIDAGYNISDDASCAFTAVGSLDSTDPRLDPDGLQRNGGPTQTIALLSRSPAKDAIPVAECTDQMSNPITTDQRGFPRPDAAEHVCDIGAYEVQDLLPFANLTAKLELTTSTGSFDLNSEFTLGTGNDGINPLTENVTLAIGPFVVTIPPGSFTRYKQRAYVFQGTINGVSLQVRINPTGGSSYTFQAEGSGADLDGIANPVTFTLLIGDDMGSTQVTAGIS